LLFSVKGKKKKEIHKDWRDESALIPLKKVRGFEKLGVAISGWKK